MNYLDEYNAIMDKYRNKEYGVEALNLHDILERANRPYLIERLSIQEVQYLFDHAHGITRLMYSYMMQNKINKISNTENIEEV